MWNAFLHLLEFFWGVEEYLRDLCRQGWLLYVADKCQQGIEAQTQLGPLGGWDRQP